jgi:hypothetical protein
LNDESKNLEKELMKLGDDEKAKSKMNRDRFMKLQRESLAFLQEESTKLREEIQKLFSSS